MKIRLIDGKHIPSKTLLIRAFVGFWLAVLMFFVAELLVWQFKPYRTATIQEPIEVINTDNIVKHGELLKLRLSINKQSDITPQVSRNVICNSGVYLVAQDVVGTARPKGEYTAYVEFAIPNLPTGDVCEFEFINDYRVNPVRVITNKWRTEPFTIGD